MLAHLSLDFSGTSLEAIEALEVRIDSPSPKAHQGSDDAELKLFALFNKINDEQVFGRQKLQVGNWEVNADGEITRHLRFYKPVTHRIY